MRCRIEFPPLISKPVEHYSSAHAREDGPGSLEMHKSTTHSARRLGFRSQKRPLQSRHRPEAPRSLAPANVHIVKFKIDLPALLLLVQNIGEVFDDCENENGVD